MWFVLELESLLTAQKSLEHAVFPKGEAGFLNTRSPSHTRRRLFLKSLFCRQREAPASNTLMKHNEASMELTASVDKMQSS